MRLLYSHRFQQAYNEAPAEIRKAFDNKARLLAQNLQHPSLHAKKYDEARGIWQARVTRSWRFYFTIEGDSYHCTQSFPTRSRVSGPPYGSPASSSDPPTSKSYTNAELSD